VVERGMNDKERKFRVNMRGKTSDGRDNSLAQEMKLCFSVSPSTI
jgi:hypothetical protein